MKNTLTPRMPLLQFLGGLLLVFFSAAVLADDYDDVTALMRAGKPAEAMGRADQVLATRPRDPQMRFLKAMILRETGKTQEALAVFTSLTEDYPELPEPHNNLAVLQASLGQLDKARASLDMALRVNPDYATAHENLGDVYLRLAASAYRRVQQLDSANTSAAAKLKLIDSTAVSPKSPASSPKGTTP
jgi:tetratricopeptide (TPR) repeat protein